MTNNTLDIFIREALTGEKSASASPMRWSSPAGRRRR